MNVRPVAFTAPQPLPHDGYVALMAILIIGAACTAIAVGVLLGGADSQRSLLVSQQSVQARQLAAACAEEALLTIQATPTFAGSGNLTLDQGSCTYTIVISSSTVRTVTVTGTVSNTKRRLQVVASTSGATLDITSWNDIS